MTDRKDAPTELLAKVEAGGAPSHDEWRNAFDLLTEVRPSEQYHQILKGRARLALMGSLNAARDLHDAVLPGWHINLTLDFCSVFPDGNDGEQLAHTGHFKNSPARAWLIAILKALIADENTNANDRKPDK